MNLNTHAGKTLQAFLSATASQAHFPLFAVINDEGAVLDWSNREMHMRAVLDVQREFGNSGSLVVIMEHDDLNPEVIPHTIQ